MYLVHILLLLDIHILMSVIIHVSVHSKPDEHLFGAVPGPHPICVHVCVCMCMYCYVWLPSSLLPASFQHPYSIYFLPASFQPPPSLLTASSQPPSSLHHQSFSDAQVHWSSICSCTYVHWQSIMFDIYICAFTIHIHTRMYSVFFVVVLVQDSCWCTHQGCLPTVQCTRHAHYAIWQTCICWTAYTNLAQLSNALTPHDPGKKQFI